ncbi:MAG: hypothetical protein CSA04_03795 [Bacteroidetes bacterium]|nr:MAG: hypothetical protein CSA04_03795 [Bacteroidota bacterium]
MDNTTVITDGIREEQQCIRCFERSYQRLFKKYSVGPALQQEFMRYFNEFTAHSAGLSSPEIQRELNARFCALMGVEDPFYEEKRESNKQALSIVNRWKPTVHYSPDPFDLTLRLAIAGNIMDYGAADDFDVDAVIQRVLHAQFAVDDSSLLREKIASASKILYLGDNAGEIVFDKLFIETNMSNRVTYVVKGGAVLNDVTMDDAGETALTEVATVISNGYNAPSTILRKSGNEFLAHYTSADLILSKGQGNLEGLMDENDERIFFLLMVKCEVIAKRLGVPKGSFVVVNGSGINGNK